MYEDEIINCVDCARPFPFTARGKEFFEKMGFVKPKRCQGCRPSCQAKVAENDASLAG